MLREPSAPSGPRPAVHPPRQSSKENHDPAVPPPRSRGLMGREPPPVQQPQQARQNKLPLYSFGGYDPSGELQHASASTQDFLPSVNFDDLHQSIAAAGIDRANEPYTEASREPLVTGSMITASPVAADPRKMDTTETRPSTGVRSIPTTMTRPSRSGSLLTRRTSVTNRQASVSQIAQPGSTQHGTNPPESGMAIRTKRASQYPPISTSNVTSKGPRRSIGLNGSEADSIRAQRRGPNSISTTSTGITPSSSIQSMSDVVAAGRALGATTGPGDASKEALSNPRAMKAKSLQPPSRNYPPQSGASRATPDRNRVSSYVAQKSPARPNGRNTATPSSAARRMSTMTGLPPSASHASGLGARTVSPTDARRMKRLSTLQGVPPLPHTPPAGSLEAAMANRPPSHSPASIQKSVTPSSLRTTPDLNRRSYMALPSNHSGGFTPRSSTSSLQPPRVPQGASAVSRLPTPRVTRGSNSEENTEEVPPVPAIPKAYESPKEEVPPQLPMYANRKSKLNFDTSSINSRNSSSTNEWSSSGRDKQHKPKESISRPRIKTTNAASSDAEDTGSSKRTAVQKKKQLQPLRLPPLNLLPLSTPTADKVAKLSANAALKQNYGSTTPPTQRSTKTPTTPMTASKTSFFSSRHRNAQRSRDIDASRSNTSIQNRDKTGFDSPTKPIPTPVRAPRQNAVSPFVSSSLPKSESEYSFMNNIHGAKPSADHGESANDQRQTKVNGPRAQTNKLTKSPKVEAQSPGKEEPSSASSLRRKLSLSWKRNTSKSSITLSHPQQSQAATERDQEYPPQPPKHDTKFSDMPPPRLPQSATMGNLSLHTGSKSPTPSLKTQTQYLDSKRRKSSISSLKLHSAVDKTPNRDELWGATDKPKVAKTPTSLLETPKLASPSSSRSASNMTTSSQRNLGPKASSMSLRSGDRWTMDLDKDDLIAEEEMRRLAMRRKETEQAARLLDSLQKRATPKERVSPQTAIQSANLNIYERGEIMDFKNVYFCGTQNAQKHIGTISSDASNHGYDDERGDYTIVVGDHLSFRYEIIDILGKGSFGQVVRCIDHMTGGLVAIKIIRNKKRFHQQALVEVDILQKLKEWDPKGKHSLISFTSSFYFRGHLCISTELLDMNLYEFIKFNSFKGFSLRLIRRFTKQLLNSLLLLKKHKVIHCDLKPENILLTHPAHSELRVIDFGSSCFVDCQVYTYIQSRFYRSPEVILGLEYGLPIDMWSVGCILAELWSGYPIFPGENETEQLACIMEVFGPPERSLIEKSGRKKLFFDSLGKPRLSVSSKGRRRKPSSKTLAQALKCDDEAFLDFLTKCLRWDQDKRLRPEDAMQHEFITGKKMVVHRRDYSSRGLERESPIRRYNQIVPPTGAGGGTSGGVRPLPMPPLAGAGFTNGTQASKARQAESPSKRNLDSATRRVSAAVGGGPQAGYAGQTVSMAQKRASAAIPNSSSMQQMSSYGDASLRSAGTGLPRMTQTRSMSGRLDLASAGATAAMYKK